MRRIQNSLFTLLFVLVVAACSGGSDGSGGTAVAEGETETDQDEVTTTTVEATTTEAPAPTEAEPVAKEPVSTEETTTTTTIDESASDEAAVTAYCTAWDDIDAFIDGDFPADAVLEAEIDGQQALISGMVPPADSLETAHEVFAGALLEFYDLLETNNYDATDAQVEDIFDGVDVVIAEGIIEIYRGNNCEGFEAPSDEEEEVDDDDGEIVSANFSFDVGLCINQSANGDFSEVDCDQPHDFQIYHAFDVDEGDGTYPGATVLAEQAEEVCLVEFETFIGVPFANSLYYATTLRPSTGSWSFGDREIVCLARAETGQLTQDLAGIAE